MKIVLTVIIAAMQFLIAIIPLRGKMMDGRLRFPHLTPKGYWLVGCCLITFICSVWLFIKIDKDDDEAQIKFENNLKFELKNANERYNSRLDSSNKRTIELLAKYGLKVDSSQKRIEKLVRDSTKMVTKIYNSVDPDFGMYNIEMLSHASDTLRLRLVFTSNDATSYKVNFKIDIAIMDLQGSLKIYGRDYILLAPNVTLNADKVLSHEITLHLSDCHSIIFYVKGDYYKVDNKRIPLGKFYSYEIAKPTPTFGMPSNTRFADIANVFKQ